MIVEKIILDDEKSDKFPVGLRVLAVDHDPICLKLLETLLRKCQYQVTTTSQAHMALNMLRENKGRFDLVISDVHMPDMDGFKLLELVGLEMDLPVIMLSGNSDPKLVMKGVTHGACDYLVKPVRVEELRNIWQHVVRRKQVDAKNQIAFTDQVNTQTGSGEGHVSPTTGNADPHGKFNRKRKDEEDDSEDNGNESEDPPTQKKPLIVWSIELHRKFVAAVNHLGIEKAVPKRILDMMNVEGLTRENVASHLQKYRLYLKRISHVTTQQANMAAAFGIKDPPFMRMGSLDGLGDFRALSGPGRLGNVALSPHSTSGILGRLNSPANMNLRNLTQSSLVQPTHSPNSSHFIGKMDPVLSSWSQNLSLFQGIPSLDLDQIQQKGTLNFNGMDDSRIFTAANAFRDSGAAIGGSSNMFNRTGDFRALSGPGRLGNVALSPYSTSGILGRLNSPANMNLRNLTQSSLVQPTHSPNLSDLIGKTNPVLSSWSQNLSLFQGIPSLDLEQIQQKGTLNFNGMDDSRIFTAANTFRDSGAVIGGSSNMFNSTGNNTMMLVGGFGNPSSNNMAFFSSESFNTGITRSSNLLDPDKCNGTWQNTIESPKMQPNSLLPTDPFHPQLPLNGMRENDPSKGSYSQKNPIVASSVPLQGSRERSCQDLVSDLQNMNQTTNQRWGEQKPNCRHTAFSSCLDTQNPENGIISSVNQSLYHNNGIFEQKMEEFVSGRSGGGVSSLVPFFAGTTKIMFLVITVFLLMLWWGF